MKPIKIIGIIIVILLSIGLLIITGILINKHINQKKTHHTIAPTYVPTSQPLLKTSLPKVSKVSDNTNTIYSIKGKLIRNDPDLYSGSIDKDGSQHPNYVKIVRNHRFQ